MISFRCPTCNGRVGAPDGYEGRKAKCPYCKDKYRIPHLNPPEPDDRTILTEKSDATQTTELHIDSTFDDDCTEAM